MNQLHSTFSIISKFDPTFFSCFSFLPLHLSPPQNPHKQTHSLTNPQNRLPEYEEEEEVTTKRNQANQNLTKRVGLLIDSNRGRTHTKLEGDDSEYEIEIFS